MYSLWQRVSANAVSFDVDKYDKFVRCELNECKILSI